VIVFVLKLDDDDDDITYTSEAMCSAVLDLSVHRRLLVNPLRYSEATHHPIFTPTFTSAPAADGHLCGHAGRPS